MPEKTFEQLKALKEGYLAYRQFMAHHELPGRFKNFSVEMLGAAINIESKLAVRGVPLEGTRVGERGMATGKADMFAELFRSGKDVPPNKMIDLAKAAQKPENVIKARDALKKFLEAANGAGGARDMDLDIRMLGEYLATQVFGATWIDAPLKGFERAWGKTEGKEINYAWALNKDFVRGTMACDSEKSLKAVTDLIKTLCTSKYGMTLIKQESQKPLEDGGDSTTGYSGWNFGVVFKEHASFAGELQANSYDVLYGKMDQAEYCKQLHMSLPEYQEKQAKLKFAGGLGHGLYEIQDKRTKGVKPAEAVRARKLSCFYYDVCRGDSRKGNVTKLNLEIMAFGPSLNSPEAIEIWKHCVNGSAWPALIQQAAERRAFRSGG